MFVVTGIAFALIAVSGLAIAKLVDDVLGEEGATHIDPKITDFLVDHRTAEITVIARATTHLADPPVLIAVAFVSIVALLARGRPRLAAFLTLSMAGAAAATSLGKLVVARPRPAKEIWLTQASGAAFPSGHATQSVAFWCALAVCAAMLSRRRPIQAAWITLGVTLAVAIGTSRVYLGVHWASDVICGWAVATAWLLALVLIGWSRPRLTTEIGAARDRLQEATRSAMSNRRNRGRTDDSGVSDRTAS